MHRLIEKGLMFGNLVPIDSPALIDRYNRALEHLCGKRTALSEFHIDLSGFAPEIGDELGDMSYLNANGCNRQFILLTTSQRDAPLLNMSFSTCRPILQEFIQSNEAALFALTAQDAVAGELQNSVFEISRPSNLLDIRRITVEADTTRSHVADGRRLQDKIETFRTDPDAWWDDVLIAEMIGLAKRTGDVTRNPVVLNQQSFAHRNFWTTHFGGAYVFHDASRPFVVAREPQAFESDPAFKLDIASMQDPNAVARALQDNGLAEPVAAAGDSASAAILRQKMDFVLIDAAAALGLDLTGTTRTDLRHLARQLGRALPDAFTALADLLRWVEAGGTWPRISSSHPAYFYTLRAAPTADRDLVNRLLAELCPMDFRQLFICHKEEFYRVYASWGDQRRQLVADFLEREYQVDKAGTRERLFGPEPGMDDKLPTLPKPVKKKKRHMTEDRIAAVGPWGALRR